MFRSAGVCSYQAMVWYCDGEITVEITARTYKSDRAMNDIDRMHLTRWNISLQKIR